MAIAVFILDLSLPLGVAGGVPYVALVLVGWWFPKRWTIVLLAAIVMCPAVLVRENAPQRLKLF